jgi:hypothetical protein
VGTDDPNDESPTGQLPRWESPTPLTPVPGPLGPTNSSPRVPGTEGDAGGAGRFGRRTRKPDRDGRPSLTSSLGEVKKPDAAQTTALVVGLLGLVVAGAGWLVQRRAGRKLREPTKAQTSGVAEPLGRILIRHADLSLLGPDLADIIAAGAGVGAYLNDGPLLEGPAVDPGLPTDLNPEEYPS